MKTNKKTWSTPVISEMEMDETNSGVAINRENGESQS
jgi:hypothetical protein